MNRSSDLGTASEKVDILFAPPDYKLTESDFRRIADRVYGAVGIVLEPHKKQMILSRLSRRLRALNVQDFGTYLDNLDKPAGEPEREAFINAVTTNLTSFFRERHHIDHFAQNILKDKIKTGSQRLRVWSAGCSSGEEPYSIALTILDAISPVPADYKILATDLDTDVLAKARAGRYQKAKSAGISQNLRRHLHDDGEGMVRMSREVISLVSFRQLNLLSNWPMHGPFDAIFCRNVLIYFDTKTKMELIERFCDLIPAGGMLYLGHSESILEEHPRLQSLGQTVYRKLDR